MAPSIKHFPGHGDTHVDSHLGLPRIRKRLEELDGTELVPWRHALKDDSLSEGSDLVTVMTGHMSLPSITGKEDEPASLSRPVTHGLLREKLGFDGVVVTDCLEMDAIADTKGIGSNPPSADDATQEEWRGGPGIEEGAVLALEAGADIVMICHTFEKQVAAIKRVWDAVESGRLNMDDLRASEERIRKWKQVLGMETCQSGAVLITTAISCWFCSPQQHPVRVCRIESRYSGESVSIEQRRFPHMLKNHFFQTGMSYGIRGLMSWLSGFSDIGKWC